MPRAGAVHLIRLGRKLDVRSESAFPTITEIANYGRGRQRRLPVGPPISADAGSKCENAKHQGAPQPAPRPPRGWDLRRQTLNRCRQTLIPRRYRQLSVAAFTRVILQRRRLRTVTRLFHLMLPISFPGLVRRPIVMATSH